MSAIAAPTTTVADVMALARESGVLMVDLRFVDLPGQAQHFSIPVKELGENLFIDGIGFDGSSIRGFQHIHELRQLGWRERCRRQFADDCAIARSDCGIVEQPIDQELIVASRVQDV